MDKVKCAELTMESFGFFSDVNIEFLSVSICSKLGIYKLFLFIYKLK